MSPHGARRFFSEFAIGTRVFWRIFLTDAALVVGLVFTAALVATVIEWVMP